jgi:hypothetical protein
MTGPEMLIAGKADEVTEFEKIQSMVANGPRINIQNIVDAFTPSRDSFPGVPVTSPWRCCTLFWCSRSAKYAVVSESFLVDSSNQSVVIDYLNSVFIADSGIQVQSDLEGWSSSSMIRNFVFIAADEDETLHYFGMVFQILNDEGYPIKRGLAQIDFGFLMDEQGRALSKEHHLCFTVEISFYELVAFAMCHCKNVSVIAEPISRQVRRWAERHRQKVFEHHRIVIEPMHQTLRREAGLAQHGDVFKAMHICRGHFGRYGDQFQTGKLFGKYEGQFWIPQHVRGKLDRGIVTKDYEVKA